MMFLGGRLTHVASLSESLSQNVRSDVTCDNVQRRNLTPIGGVASSLSPSDYSPNEAIFTLPLDSGRLNCSRSIYLLI